MIKDRKGEGGFLEALSALMIVTVTLTSFLGMLSYSELGSAERTTELDTSFIDDLELCDGKMIGDTVSHLGRFVEKNSLNGARLYASIAGNSDVSRTDTVGIADGNNVGSISGTCTIDANDGRTFVLTYEVVYWWD